LSTNSAEKNSIGIENFSRNELDLPKLQELVMVWILFQKSFFQKGSGLKKILDPFFPEFFLSQLENFFLKKSSKKFFTKIHDLFLFILEFSSQISNKFKKSKTGISSQGLNLLPTNFIAEVIFPTKNPFCIFPDPSIASNSNLSTKIRTLTFIA